MMYLFLECGMVNFGVVIDSSIFFGGEGGR